MATKKKTTKTKNNPVTTFMAVNELGLQEDAEALMCRIMDGETYFDTDLSTLNTDCIDQDETDYNVYKVTFTKVGVSKSKERTFIPV